jgi:NADH:ubiquinone oxidoreductase subunit 4 (subunit M)
MYREHNPMFQGYKPAPAAKSGFAQTLDRVAMVLAFIATFFLAPLFFQVTIVWVLAFTATHYGDSLLGVVSLLWIGASGAIVYWVARGLVTAFLMKHSIRAMFGG